MLMYFKKSHTEKARSPYCYFGSLLSSKNWVCAHLLSVCKSTLSYGTSPKCNFFCVIALILSCPSLRRTCGEGTQTRQRQCEAQTARLGLLNSPCKGAGEEPRACREADCPKTGEGKFFSCYIFTYLFLHLVVLLQAVRTSTLRASSSVSEARSRPGILLTVAGTTSAAPITTGPGPPTSSAAT